eukprot:4418332-Prymnesium_polylepis.1
MLSLAIACSGSIDGLSEKERAKCDRKAAFVRSNYELCCGMGRYMSRERICKKAWAAIKPPVSEDERSPSWPKIRRDAASERCTACARL